MARVGQQWLGIPETMRNVVRNVAQSRYFSSVYNAQRRSAALSCSVVRWGALAVVIALASLSPVAAAQAQSSGNGFLFGQPQGSFTIRGGFDRASAGGDLFAFVTDELTLRRGDFSGPAVGADVALRVSPRFDVVLSGAYASASASSEFRRLVDTNNMPIAQTTTFRRVPVTASVRAYLKPRGRSIGNLAWVPARFAPYVGVGGGAAWYRFQQVGDFVDPGTNAVFSDDLTTSGWAPAAQATAGLDYSLTPRIALTGEGRYTWSKAAVGQSFTGFDRVDLSGVSTTLGLSVRF